MLQRVGNEVASLERVRFGPLALGTLPAGRRGSYAVGGGAALEGCRVDDAAPKEQDR